MSGAGQNGHMNILFDFFLKNLLQSFGARLLQPFHGQQESLAVQSIAVELFGQRTKMLAADRNNNRFVIQHLGDIFMHNHIIRKSKIPVPAGFF